MDFPFGQIVNDGDSQSLNTIDIAAEVQGQIDRFGIQALPNTPFILNGETLYIGRSGVFEAAILVDSLVISERYRFIVDYHIKAAG